MKKNKLGQAGYASAEILMAMALVAILGIAIVILIYSGSETYQRINANKNAEIDARNALAYVNIKTRQNDVQGNVTVEPMPGSGENALVIRQAVEDEIYQTWIFLEEGQLWECLILEGETPSRNLSFRLVAAEGFDVSLSGSWLEVKVRYIYSGEPEVLASRLYLRSQKPQTYTVSATAQEPQYYAAGSAGQVQSYRDQRAVPILDARRRQHEE